MLYSTKETINRDPSEFGKLWVDARNSAILNLEAAKNLSSDRGRFDLGVYVAEKQYTFILTFFRYDDVTVNEDYPM